MCEQVSHHPPVSAFHAESSAFRFHGSIHPKIKFWGKSVEIQPKGVLTVELPEYVHYLLYIIILFIRSYVSSNNYYNYY